MAIWVLALLGVGCADADPSDRDQLSDPSAIAALERPNSEHLSGKSEKSQTSPLDKPSEAGGVGGTRGQNAPVSAGSLLEDGERADLAGLPGQALAESGPIVRLSPKYLSPLYEGFFLDQLALRDLSLRLGGVVSLPRVDVEVQWTERTSEGRITLYVPEEDRRGEEIAAALKQDEPLDLSPIQPFLVALGAYRAELGGRFDLRLLSFDLRLSFWDRISGTHCTIDGRANDPEGRDFAACFRCLDPRKGKVEVCRTEADWPSLVEGEKKALRRLHSALQSTPL